MVLIVSLWRLCCLVRMHLCLLLNLFIRPSSCLVIGVLLDLGSAGYQLESRLPSATADKLCTKCASVTKHC